jgi:N-methylhydantoinase A
MLTSDLRYEVSSTHYSAGQRITAQEVRTIFADLEREATGRLKSWFGGDVAVERSAEMRYGEQIFQIDVPLNDLDWNSENIVDRIEERFHRRHEELYTYSSPDQEAVFVNARVAAIGAVPSVGQVARGQKTVAPCKPKGRRKAFFGEWREVEVFAADQLRPGNKIEGPAIVEAETTTVLVGDGDQIEVNDLGWLDIRLR